ncbi:MAG TPA: hypothetical protein DDZ81_00865 [Acetobacteraceae bacterium]|jgi:hypothetical protein|nr:hypothetical protein [Acetobacteraceae bacterium]
MYLQKFVRNGFGAMSLLLTLIGCSSIGPGAIPRDRTDYLSSIADSWKEQTLLNVVRLRYGDAPSFLDVSSVISNYAIGGQLTAGGIINSNPTSVAPWNSATFSGGVAYQDRPTVSYTPLSGDKFTKSLLRPIPPVGIFQLIQAGFPADFVLQITVRSLNGIKNQGVSGGQVQAADPAFYPLLDALRRLQLSGTVSLRLEKRGPEEVGVLVLASSRTPQVNQDLNFVMDTLHLRPGKDGELAIVFGAVQRNEKEFAVLSRSMAEILIDLAAGIEVPPEHVAERRTMPSTRLATAENPRDRPLVRIQSGPAVPPDAFSSIHYRNTWYWISDRDFVSKRVFTLLMIFFSLAETGVAPQVPALTIPVG